MSKGPRFGGRKAAQSLFAQNGRQLFKPPLDTFFTSHRPTLAQAPGKMKHLLMHNALGTLLPFHLAFVVLLRSRLRSQCSHMALVVCETQRQAFKGRSVTLFKAPCHGSEIAAGMGDS